jgi:hypothetical protein
MSHICQFPYCKNIASFGYETDGIAAYCTFHKAEDMVPIIRKTKGCDRKGCKKFASYKTINESVIRKACDIHKEEGMVPIIYSKCCLCDRKGVYYDPRAASDVRKKYCRLHKQEGMTCFRRRLCEEDDCLKLASFNYPGEDKPLYCKSHKKEDMVNIISRHGKKERTEASSYHDSPCSTQNSISCSQYEEKMRKRSGKCRECNRKALYNYEPPAMYCQYHKKQDMVIVVRECHICGRKARFNYPGSIAAYCRLHKSEGMVDVYIPTCRECNDKAYYGPRGTNEKLYCSKHKKEEMVNNAYKNLCLECNKRARYGFEDEVPLYCLKHKKEGMIDVCLRRKCDYPGCTNCPRYHYKSKQSPKYCGLHKKKGMTTKSLCKFEACERYATYAFEEDKKLTFCGKHKRKGMIKKRFESDDTDSDNSIESIDLNVDSANRNLSSLNAGLNTDPDTDADTCSNTASNTGSSTGSSAGSNTGESIDLNADLEIGAERPSKIPRIKY